MPVKIRRPIRILGSPPIAGQGLRQELVQYQDKTYGYTGDFWIPLQNLYTPETVTRAPAQNEFPDPRGTALTHWTNLVAGTMSLRTDDAPAATTQMPAGTGTTSVQDTLTSPGGTLTAIMVASDTTQSPNGTPVVPGDILHVLAAFKIFAGSATGIQMAVNYYNAAGSGLAGHDASRMIYQTVSPTTGSWYVLEGIDTAPASAAFARIIFSLLGTTAVTTTVRVTNLHVVIDPLADVPSLVAGDIATQPAGAWKGTANNSKSSRPLDVGTIPASVSVGWGFNDYVVANNILPSAAAAAQINAEVGVTASRMGFTPGRVVASQAIYNAGNVPGGGWDWSFYDNLIGEYAKVGVKIYAECGYDQSQFWMTPSVSQAQFNLHAYPPDSSFNATYAAICAEFVKRYRQHIVGFEVWNEPNLQFFWFNGPSASAYTTFLTAIYNALHPVAPEIPVVGGSLSFRSTVNNAAAPTIGTAVNGSGGSLANNTYFYKVTALNANGETIGSGEVSAASTGSNHKITVTWTAHPYATGYRLYRSTTSGVYTAGYLPVVDPNAVSYVDDGAISLTAGSIPGASTMAIMQAFDTFLTAMYAAGAKTVMDAIAFHPYGPWVGTASDSAPTGNQVGWDRGPEEQLRAIRAIMATNTDSAKPLHASEWGFASVAAPAQGQVTEAQQAIVLPLMRGWLARQGMRYIGIHTLLESPSPGSFEIVETPKLRPKAAFYSLRQDWYTTGLSRHEASFHPNLALDASYADGWTMPQAGAGVGDKLALYSTDAGANRAGFGIQSFRIVAFMPTGWGLSIARARGVDNQASLLSAASEGLYLSTEGYIGFGSGTAALHTALVAESFGVMAIKDFATQTAYYFLRAGTPTTGSPYDVVNALWLGTKEARGASTANITISPGGTTFVVDGVTYANGQTILLKNQTTASQNGLYTVGGVGTSVTLTRHTWAPSGDTTALRTGVEIQVSEGTLNGGATFRVTNTGAVTIGTTGLTFRRVDEQEVWTTVIQAKGSIAALAAAGTYVMKTDGTALTLATLAMTAGSAFFPLDSAQYAIGGMTPQVRIVGSVLNNATAPTGNFTFHLYSFTTAGLIPTLTAAVGEQTAVVSAPGADAQVVAYGTAFTMPATTGQGFLLAVVTSAQAAAGSSPSLTALLQVRAV